jgi:hypothetical protein
MNIPPSEAERLSLHDYEGILWNWNDGEGGDEVPDRDTTMLLIDRINADPRFTGPKAPAEVN